jgi:hypothetical protein
MRKLLFLAMLFAASAVGRAYAADASSTTGGALNGRKVYAQEIAKLKPISFDAETVRDLAGTQGFKVYEGNPILSPGDEGTWDAGAIGSMTVLMVDGIYHMYYEAWGVMHEKVQDEDYNSLQIGHAISLDGIHWIKDPANPVIPKGTGDEWDALGTWDPYVIYENGVFKMWYGGGVEPHCDWAYAESTDGRHFVKRGRISQLHHVEDDHVVHDADTGRYYMYYWDRAHEPHGLHRAESPNETDFDFAGAVPLRIEGHDPDEMYKFTHVVRENGDWYMLYADFERPNCPHSITRLAESTDGVHWKNINGRLFEGQDADVLRVGDSLYLAYYGPQGYFDQKNGDVRLAVYQGTLRELGKQDKQKD